MILDSAGFHCQQAVEKCLKGFLVFKGQEIEKTHNIRFLLDECAKFDSVFGQIDPLNLNAFAVHFRYPDMGLAPDLQEATALYDLATKIDTLVKERIVFAE